MAGKYFDEFVVGEEYVTPSRTLTETDIVLFAAMSGDYNELHTSEAFGKETQFGKRIGHGLLGLAVSHGLFFRLGLVEGTAIAFLGLESWNFEAPFFIGDTISAELTITETKALPRIGGGSIVAAIAVKNQSDEICQRGSLNLLVLSKPK